jgi:hypothetical protein
MGRHPMGTEDGSPRGFPLFAYCCTPIQPPMAYVKQFEAFALAKVITTNIHLNRMAR